MTGRKDVLVVIFKLLAANRTDDMGGPWLWLLNMHRPFLSGSELAALFKKIFLVLRVQRSIILLRKLALFLQLEDACTERSFNVEVWNIIPADVNFLAQITHQRFLLGYCVR